jgi:aerobic carbon-monoxide dehydrogenase medium subunit
MEPRTMMNLREILRPETMEEALALLKRPGAVVLAGGTELVAARRRDVRAVVDLSDLGLAYIRDKRGDVAIGAMSTLADVSDSPILRAAANGIVARGAHRSAASLLRNQATAAGTVIAEPAGIFATVMAAMEARVVASTLTSLGRGERSTPLVEFLRGLEQFLAGAIVTELVIPASSLRRRAAFETVARTPRDNPIVTVCAALDVEGGVVNSASIALGGIGHVVVRVSGVERILLNARLNDETVEHVAREAMNGITPRTDLRGSAEYRKAMVRVLTARALREIANSR